ncbi:MAG: molybdopterin molybdotransferase MoeA [Candidatus Bathyarchaeia archaeon]
MERIEPKRSLKLAPYPEALEKLFKVFQSRSFEYESISVEESIGRVLTEDIIANVDAPERDIAMVDGYTVKFKDVSGASAEKPVLLKIIGKFYPWDNPVGVKLLEGEAAYVTCGAPLPEGADAVIMVENAVFRDGKIEVRRPVKEGENVIHAGEDIRRGDIILRAGSILRPQDVGVLAGLGIRKVNVARKPRVAIIATGNELIELSKREPARIADNYALIVSGLISRIGGEPLRLSIAPDDLDEIKRRIKEALESADIIVTVGGCSMGEKDFVPDAVNSLGQPGVIIHGIRVKPGKVTGFGMVRGKPIVMLPGLLASTMAGFYLIFVPLISLYMGLKVEQLLPTITVRMGHDLDLDEKPLYRFLPVRIKGQEGKLYAEAVPGGPNSLSRFVKANGFILIPPKKRLRREEEVSVTLYSKDEFSRFFD